MTELSGVTARPRRSPSYPALDLAQALGRAEELYRAEGQHAVPIDAAIKHWGYSSQNGRTNVTISALKKYGLIVDSGSGRARKIQVTDLTRRILEHPLEGERRALIQRAALLPKALNEMWHKYRATPPSDESWKWELKEEYNFTDPGAEDFVRVYRATVDFAKLGDLEAEDPDVGEDVLDDAEDDEPEPTPRYEFPLAQARQIAEARRTAVEIPLPGGGSVAIHGQFPISEGNWDYLDAVLKAMKPGLVAPETASE